MYILKIYSIIMHIFLELKMKINYLINVSIFFYCILFLLTFI